MIENFHSIRRKLIFSRWYNLVHDEIPKRIQADEFHLRWIFHNFRNYAESRRDVRRQQQ